MENIVKIAANQGSFDNNKNLVDIDIDGGIFDFSKSYVNVNVSVFGTLTAKPDAVYATGLNFKEGRADNDTVVPPSNGVLVKHAQLRNEKAGVIESVRHNDVLRAGLGLYERDKGYYDKDLGNMININTVQNFSKLGFQELYNEGSTNSRNRPADIRIPLTEILGAGVIDDYDTQKMGKTRLHMEMNFSKITEVSVISNGNPWGAEVRTGGNAYGAFADYTNGTGANQDVNFLTTTQAYDNLDDSPYYVAQPLTITLNNAGAGAGALAGNPFVITQIEHLQTGHLKLTFDAVLVAALGAGAALTTITAVQTAANSFSRDINKVELVLYKRNDISEGADEVQFSSFHADNDTYPAATSLNRQYYLPPNCMNALIMFNNPILSQEPITSYRIGLNGKSITNRDVEVKSGLHYDLINKTFINMGKNVKNFAEKSIKSAVKQSANATQIDTRILACPVPLSARQTQLSLELNASGNMGGQQIIFAHVLKKV